MPKRRAFFSFHYNPDNWRVGQVRNMGMVEGNAAVSDNGWETVTKGGAAAIQRWIDDQMYGKSCVIVLIGSNTAGRKWINYEIKKAWNEGKGVLGVYIHKLKDQHGNQSPRGENPFKTLTIGETNAAKIVRAYDPYYKSSPFVYSCIADNIADWVEEAISIRSEY